MVLWQNLQACRYLTEVSGWESHHSASSLILLAVDIVREHSHSCHRGPECKMASIPCLWLHHVIKTKSPLPHYNETSFSYSSQSIYLINNHPYSIPILVLAVISLYSLIPSSEINLKGLVFGSFSAST